MTVYRSHADEVAALMGSDHSYIDAVQANYYQMEAGRHVRRMLEALLVPAGDCVPRRDLEALIREYEWLAAGNPADWLASVETGAPHRGERS